MAVKLHRCTTDWIKGPHPCWRVQKALDEAGIEYEIVRYKGRRNREALKALSGQEKLPVIEFEDGRALREDSRDMAKRIAEGRLFEDAPAAAPADPA